MYCITLRSRTDTSITGWYDGSHSGWSTDQKRQRLFDKKGDARPVCQDLRKLCPRNAKVINIEPSNVLRSGVAAKTIQVPAELPKIIEH